MDSRVVDSFARQAFMRTLGASLRRAEPGHVAIVLPASEHLGQQQGYLHGGALISVIDSACGYAALTTAPAGKEVLTAELKVNLLAPVSGSAVVATGRILRAGRRLSVCQGEARDADDPQKLLASMLATMVIVDAN